MINLVAIFTTGGIILFKKILVALKIDIIENLI
jgi:hypothetical protein